MGLVCLLHRTSMPKPSLFQPFVPTGPSLPPPSTSVPYEQIPIPATTDPPPPPSFLSKPERVRVRTRIDLPFEREWQGNRKGIESDRTGFDAESRKAPSASRSWRSCAPRKTPIEVERCVVHGEERQDTCLPRWRSERGAGTKGSGRRTSGMLTPGSFVDDLQVIKEAFLEAQGVMRVAESQQGDRMATCSSDHTIQVSGSQEKPHTP